MIRKKGKKWILYDKSGKKVLGRFPSEEAALAREKKIKQIVALKRKQKKEGNTMAFGDAQRVHFERAWEAERSTTREIDIVHEEFRKQFSDDTKDIWAWVREVWLDESYVIAKYDGTFYKVTFQMKEEDVSFAPRSEWIGGEFKFIPFRESALEIFRPAHEALADVLVANVSAEEVQVLESCVRLTAAKKGKEGKEWEVNVIGPETEADLVEIEGVEYVRSKNGRLYLTSALEESVEIWDGVKVFDNHLTNEEFEKKQGMRSVAKEWIGVLVKPFWDKAANTVKATLKVIDEAVMKKLKNAEEAGVLDAIGLSIDALGTGSQKKVGDAMVQIVEKLTKAISVDVVADPAAGGKFARMLAGG